MGVRLMMGENDESRPRNSCKVTTIFFIAFVVFFIYTSTSIYDWGGSINYQQFFNHQRRRLAVCKWVAWKQTNVCSETAEELLEKTSLGQPTTSFNSRCLAPGSTNPKNKRYFLSVGIVVRSEAHFIEEWARHYISEGVERIYMVDQENLIWGGVNKPAAIGKLGPTASALESALPNRTTHVPTPKLASKTASRASVQGAAKSGLVGHLSVANMPNMGPAYIAIVNIAKKESEWILMVDSDEYMFATSPLMSTAEVLKKIEKSQPTAGQISVPWMVFGTSGHVPMPKCIIPSFTMRVPYDFDYNDEDDGGGNIGRRYYTSEPTSPLSPSATSVKTSSSGGGGGVGHTSGGGGSNGFTSSSSNTFTPSSQNLDMLKRAGVGSSISSSDPFAFLQDKKKRRKRRRLEHRQYTIENIRRMFGIGLVKSFIKLDALPFRSWDPSVKGVVHAQRLCPGWVTLSADATPKVNFIPAAVKKGGRPNLSPNDWTMHDWVRIDTALFRLHHYKYRSKEWMLKVKSCRGLALTGNEVSNVPDVQALIHAMEKEDEKSYICDSTLAHRQAFGPGTVHGVGSGSRGACGAWPYPASRKDTSGSGVVSSDGVSPKKDWISLIGGRSESYSEEYVNLGVGCGLDLGLDTSPTNPIVNYPKCDKSQEDSLVIDYLGGRAVATAESSITANIADASSSHHHHHQKVVTKQHFPRR